MEMPYQIRNAYRDEWEDAMSLAWRTFLRFEADVYSPEGVRNFENFITDSTLYRMFVVGSYQMFVALDGKKIVGMGSRHMIRHTFLCCLWMKSITGRESDGRLCSICQIIF